MFLNIPGELRDYEQWIVWKYEKVNDKLTKVPYDPKTGYLANVNEPNTWTTFSNAIFVANNYNGIGFVLTKNDPFAFIDLDDANNNKDICKKQIEIYEKFNSYAEYSPSGKGLHIIIKGELERGRRKNAIEIYSSQRYMTMTGDVFRNEPIKNYNKELNELCNEFNKNNSNFDVLASGTDFEKYDDEKILNIAATATNGEKFIALHEGNWQAYYASQSEADFAYINIIAFYTQNKEQIVRMFRASALGKRSKAMRADYVNHMLNRSFDKMIPQVNLDGLKDKLTEVLEKKDRKVTSHLISEFGKKITTLAEHVYTVPPGLVGEMAQFIYAAAPRPVPEIALAGALGLTAGIVGRSYNVSGTGLNQYVLLLAPTGTGKEAMASGLDKLMAAVVRSVPAAIDFVGPGEIASPQALLKYMSKSASSFVSLVGEFGIQLQQMAAWNAPSHLLGLRRMLLDLYNKSGEGKVLRPSIYSDREKNTASVIAPAFTLLGESTPEKYYEALHEGMISEGLLPRFTTIEYHGVRPPLNTTHASAFPSSELIEKLSTLCANSLMLNSQHRAVHVQIEKDAQFLFDEFDIYCDLNINTSEREIKRHLWNRAHIKSLKLAALIAVGCNPYDPLITHDVAIWSINLIISDVRNLLRRFDAGDIGFETDETKQLQKVIDNIKDYVTMPWNEVSRYTSENTSKLHHDKIVPYGYLQRRLAAIAIFRKDKLGSSTAIKRALKTLVERGDLQEINKITLMKNYNVSAVCYVISNLKSFGFI